MKGLGLFTGLTQAGCCQRGDTKAQNVLFLLLGPGPKLF